MRVTKSFAFTSLIFGVGIMWRLNSVFRDEGEIMLSIRDHTPVLLYTSRALSVQRSFREIWHLLHSSSMV